MSSNLPLLPQSWEGEFEKLNAPKEAPETREEAEESIQIRRFPFLLGRHSECDFALFSRLVSRHHCRFFVRDGCIWVDDLNSHNGTFINDREVREPEPLFDGDILVIHPYQFLCRTEGETSGNYVLKLIRLKESSETK